MPAMALPPSDTGTSRPLSGATRNYEFVDDVGIGVSTQFKFPRYSLPNWAYSSPGLGRKKVDDGGRGLQRDGQRDLNRSRSCGEGRGKAAPHDVEIWVQNDNRVAVAERQKERRWKTENGEGEGRGSGSGSGGKARRCGGQFRCGAVCMLLPLLPGFRVGKGKGEREKEREGEGEGEEGDQEEGSGCISISISSRRVSLEKFECGSWASSGMVVHEDGESGTGSLYFDLPMELIRNSVGAQTQSPVKAAFELDRNGKGVALLPVWTKAKLGEGSGGASLTPSPSPPSCIITPRLRKAREEFNALLEAHAQTL